MYKSSYLCVYRKEQESTNHSPWAKSGLPSGVCLFLFVHGLWVKNGFYVFK